MPNDLKHGPLLSFPASKTSTYQEGTTKLTIGSASIDQNLHRDSPWRVIFNVYGYIG
jgi:hypothetical protein